MTAEEARKISIDCHGLQYALMMESILTSASCGGRNSILEIGTIYEFKMNRAIFNPSDEDLKNIIGKGFRLEKSKSHYFADEYIDCIEISW